MEKSSRESYVKTNTIDLLLDFGLSRSAARQIRSIVAAAAGSYVGHSFIVLAGICRVGILLRRATTKEVYYYLLLPADNELYPGQSKSELI